MIHRCGALTTCDAVQRMVLEDVAWSSGQHEEAPDGTWEADQLAGIAQWLEGIISLYHRGFAVFDGLLQWSHVPANVETTVHASSPQSCTCASMEPRSCERGNRVVLDAARSLFELQWSHVPANVETAR